MLILHLVSVGAGAMIGSITGCVLATYLTVRSDRAAGRHRAPERIRYGQTPATQLYDEADRAIGLCGWVSRDSEHCHFPAGHELPHQPLAYLYDPR